MDISLIVALGHCAGGSYSMLYSSAMLRRIDNKQTLVCREVLHEQRLWGFWTAVQHGAGVLDRIRLG